MASQQTPNYKLSRWAGTDRILMEEFNSDNEKIDAALTTALLEKRAIKTVTLTDPQEVEDIPLDDINWAEWSVVGMEVPYRPAENDTRRISCHPNKGSLAFCQDHKTGLMWTTINPFTLLFLPMRDPERNVSSLALINGGGYGYADKIPFKSFTSLRIIYSSKTSPFPKGQKIYFWGIR